MHLQHGRVREFLAVQRDRWQEAEARLLAQIERLTAETQSLRERCTQLQSDLAARPAEGAPGGNEEAIEDLHRRYEMALEDLRELKARNAGLQEQLAQAPASRPAAGGAVRSDVLDWEVEKRRILDVLEADADRHDPRVADERLRIENVIRKTDQLLAEKDREIEELQNILKQQSGSLGTMAVGAAAVGELLNKDTIIREEREHLKRLQEEWHAKVRQAEIDVSLERAKIARQQTEIAEKLRELELRTAKPEAQTEALSPTGRPTRGRWLARLGLKDLDDDKA
jgi:hypothetical protein